MSDKFHADYTYSIEGNVIAIIDLCLGGRSVSDDIETVLREISRALNSDLSGYALVYRDSHGNWDGIRVIDGNTIDFYALRETTQEGAVRRLLHLMP